MADKDKNKSGTKDLTIKTAIARLFNRSRRIEDAVDSATSRRRDAQSTDSNN